MSDRVYKPDAGECPKCGRKKTWGFRVLNETSGKMMPGHIDDNGYKLGERGDCPAYVPKQKSTEAAAPAPAQPAPAVTASPAPVTPATNDVAGLMFVQSSLEKLVAGQERHYEGIAAILAQIRDELAIANVNRATSAPGVK